SGQQRYFSDLLRSRCPVTAQPDWASVAIELNGPMLDEEGLLRYLIAFRQKNDFHEQCVEQIFCDIINLAGDCELTVYARYLRRGGLDINPWRSNCRPSLQAENLRLPRQ
ncbi:MAG: NADPH-dependent 7-cyano-7-deazaguanine reductase QueF, partial [Spongiibacter sp.]